MSAGQLPNPCLAFGAKLDRVKQLVDVGTGGIERPEEPQRLFHGQLVGQLRFLQLNPEPRAEGGGRTRPPLAEDLYITGIRHQEAFEDLDGGGLPCAVRSEQAETLASHDGKVQSIHGDERTVSLHDTGALQGEGGRCHIRDCKPWYTRRSVSSRIVLIGPADALPSLQARLEPGTDIQTFTDSDALEALDHIIRTKPSLVAMQDEFSATSRGIALINRISDDPSLTACEVRILARDATQNRVAVKRSTGGGAAAVAVEDQPKPALDQRGTRRAPRVRIKDGVEVSVDGNVAALIDLSRVGAQVVSPTILKPNQRVRVAIGDARVQVKCQGAIAWAAFEMPKGLPTRYRAGIDFGTAADGDGIAGFADRNKKD